MLFTEAFFDDMDTDKLGEVGEFSVDIDGGFSEIPVLEKLRALDSSDDWDTQSKIAKYSLRGKKVVVLYDGKPVGGPFTVNSLVDAWDSFDVFKIMPLALKFVFGICMADMLKKSNPPRKSTPGVVAGSAN